MEYKKIMRNIFNKIKKRKMQFGELLDRSPEFYDMRFYLRRIELERSILHSSESGISKEMYCDHEIIVSLTSYGRRLQDVCFTIESLMQQVLKANKIILWLDEDERDQELPNALKSQIKRGLEIQYFKDDIRSYKKLIPALINYPDAAIITVDDDIIYDFDILDRIISSYLKYPDCIHACRIHTMTFDDNDNIKPYKEWMWYNENKNNPSRHFLTGVGGVLYPPHSLHEEVCDIQTFAKICPTADDVWFTAMALLNQTEIKKVPTRNKFGNDFIENPNFQDMGLCNINVGGERRNDIQIRNVFEKYDINSFLKK